MEKTTKVQLISNNTKLDNLQQCINESYNPFLNTNQGLKINDSNNSLKSGERGNILLEDFILREKITHFDHIRIFERNDKFLLLNRNSNEFITIARHRNWEREKNPVIPA